MVNDQEDQGVVDDTINHSTATRVGEERPRTRRSDTESKSQWEVDKVQCEPRKDDVSKSESIHHTGDGRHYGREDEGGVVDDQEGSVELFDFLNRELWDTGEHYEVDGGKGTLDDSSEYPWTVREDHRSRPRRKGSGAGNYIPQQPNGTSPPEQVLAWLIDMGWEPDEGRVERMLKITAEKRVARNGHD